MWEVITEPNTTVLELKSKYPIGGNYKGKTINIHGQSHVHTNRFTNKKIVSITVKLEDNGER